MALYHCCREAADWSSTLTEGTFYQPYHLQNYKPTSPATPKTH